MKNYKIIVDGSNEALFRRDNHKKAKIKNIEIIMEYLEKLSEQLPIEYEIITDANLRYRIDDKEKLENLYKTGRLIQCPSGIRADEFIIEYAKRHPEETIIISNDNFTIYDNSNLNVCKFVIMFEEILIKPDLYDFLEFSEEIQQEVKENVHAI